MTPWLLALAGGIRPPLAADVFAPATYTGNGSTRIVTTGINLSSSGPAPYTQGGLVLIKRTSGTNSGTIYDTVMGTGKYLEPDTTGGIVSVANTVTAFGTSSFTLGAATRTNASGVDFVSWTFRQARPFLSIVDYTGTGSSQAIAHGLGGQVGMVWVKRTDNTSPWYVWHSGLTSGNYAVLNTTAAETTTGAANVFGNGSAAVDPTGSTLTVGSTISVNTATYRAYVFGSAAGVCQAFGYAGSGSTVTVNLGFSPRFVLIKRKAGGTGEWYVWDSARGFNAGSETAVPIGSASGSVTADALDISGTVLSINNTGDANWNASGSDYIGYAVG